MTLLKDRTMDTMLAVAAALRFPESGISVGMAKNAIFAANNTAAYNGLSQRMIYLT